MILYSRGHKKASELLCSFKLLGTLEQREVVYEDEYMCSASFRCISSSVEKDINLFY